MSFQHTFLEKEVKAKDEGTFVSQWGRDALVEALIKPDNYGRARGIGGLNVGIKQTFVKVDKKGHKPRSIKRLIAHNELQKALARNEAEIEDKLTEHKVRLEARMNVSFQAFMTNFMATIVQNGIQVSATMVVVSPHPLTMTPTLATLPPMPPKMPSPPPRVAAQPQVVNFPYVPTHHPVC